MTGRTITAMTEDRLTYLLVDGENIDGALGSIIGHRPEPGQRPRWQHLLDFVGREFATGVRGLFFINASHGYHAAFVQALVAIGYRPILLAGAEEEKVVDIGILRMLGALRDQPGDVLVASHDADFAEDLRALVDTGGRRVGAIGFAELTSQRLRDIEGLELFDLEHDAKAFEVELPRLRVIPIAEFDPTLYL